MAGLECKSTPCPTLPPSPGGAAQASEGTPLFLFLSAPATGPRNAMPESPVPGLHTFCSFFKQPSLPLPVSPQMGLPREVFPERSARSLPLVSIWGLRKPVTTTRRHQTTEINVFSHRAGGQRSELQVSAGPRFSAGSRGQSLPRLPPTFPGGCSNPWRSLACRSITPAYASTFTWHCSLCLCPHFPHKDTSHWLRAHFSTVYPHLNWTASAKTSSLNKVTFIGVWG